MSKLFNKQFFHLLLIAGILFGLFLPISCTSNVTKGEENGNATAEGEQESPIVKETPPSGPRPQIGVIVFDGSLSMKGYVDATTAGKFQDVIGKLNNLGETTQSFTFDTVMTPVDDILSKVQNKKIAWAKESDLSAMVKEVMTKGASEPSNVYILVTDGIISGSNEEIMADSFYNISKPSILSSRIEKLINEIPSEKNMAVLVAKWDTPFKGIYYEYDNGHKKLGKGSDTRPFYVIAVGEMSKVAYTDSILDAVGGKQSVTYGTTYSVPLRLTNGKLQGANHYIQDMNMKNDGITAELNISNLPAYARNLNYLQKNLEIKKTSGEKKKNIRILTRGDNAEEATGGDYELSLEGNKLLVTFSDKIKNQVPSSFEFCIKRSQPQWVMDATTLNDKTDYHPLKTLNLTYFLNPFLQLNGKTLLNDPAETSVKISKSK